MVLCKKAARAHPIDVEPCDPYESDETFNNLQVVGECDVIAIYHAMHERINKSPWDGIGTVGSEEIVLAASTRQRRLGKRLRDESPTSH